MKNIYFLVLVLSFTLLKAQNFYIDENSFRDYLKSSNLKTKLKLSIPVRDNSVEIFSITENDLIRNKVNNVFTFDGVSKSGAILKLTSINNKLYGLILRNGEFQVFEPTNENSNYYSYINSKDLEENIFNCSVDGVISDKLSTDKTDKLSKISIFPSTQVRRTYRLAIAATPSFTNNFDNVDAALNNIILLVNNLNAIYENELNVSFVLSDETLNKKLLFTDAANNPFNSNCSLNANCAQNGFRIMNDSGYFKYNQYDLGHVLNTKSTIGVEDGSSFLSSVCNDSIKGASWSNWSLSTSTYFGLVVLAHEIGHMFSATHSFNASGGNSSDLNACFNAWGLETAVEPGSGITIMSYNGACSSPNQNIKTGRKMYFHSKNLEQIFNFLENTSKCDVKSPIVNNLPIVFAGEDIVIPKNTPFTLNGSAVDADNDIQSYTWEQIDVATIKDKGAFADLYASNYGIKAVNSFTAPLFVPKRSSIGSERNFPSTSILVKSDDRLSGEALPLVPRDLNFRFLVKDLKGFNYDDIKVKVSDYGPLSISNMITQINDYSKVNITWAVNNTNLLIDKVDILLSFDDGLSFPILLAKDTPNDGNEVVFIPNFPSYAFANIKILAKINDNASFFAITYFGFQIKDNCNNPSVFLDIKNNYSVSLNKNDEKLDFKLPSTPNYISKLLDNTTFLKESYTSYEDSPYYINKSLTDKTPYLYIANEIKGYYKIRPLNSGIYNINNLFDTGLTIHSGYPMSAENFVGSNSYLSGNSLTKVGTLSVYLDKDVTYYFRIANKDFTYYQPQYFPNKNLLQINLGFPHNYGNYTYTYTYVAIDKISNRIVSYSNTANFKNLPIGEYTICCLSFLNTYNPDSFINLDLDELYNISPCIQKSFNSFSLKVNENLSVLENDNKSFKLYPNPVKNILTYESEKSIEKLEIYDVIGTIKKIKILDKNKLDVSNLIKGVYILKIYFKNNISQTHKFIKE